MTGVDAPECGNGPGTVLMAQGMPPCLYPGDGIVYNVFRVGRMPAMNVRKPKFSRRSGRIVRLLAAVFFAMLFQRPANASLILGRHDWSPGTPEWQSDHGFAQLAPQPAGGNPAGWLEILFPATDGDPQTEMWDVAYTDASSLFAGGWETNMWVQTDFWSTNDLSPTVQVRWQSSKSSYVWAYEVSSGVGNGWRTLTAPLTRWSDWDILDPGGASEEAYLDDLANIDWIGVFIGRSGNEEQTYGLDDFSLMVPEPSQFLMLGAALAASGLSLRRRRS